MLHTSAECHSSTPRAQGTTKPNLPSALPRLRLCTEGLKGKEKLLYQSRDCGETLGPGNYPESSMKI